VVPKGPATDIEVEDGVRVTSGGYLIGSRPI
jgi:hypothetical protein